MRIGALLLVAMAFVCSAACTASTSSDQVCISGGGQCFASTDSPGCGEFQSGLLCDNGQVCCTPSGLTSDGGIDATTTTTTNNMPDTGLPDIVIIAPSDAGSSPHDALAGN